MNDSSTRPVNPQNTCPNCGRQNRLDAAKCWWCGTPLAVDPSRAGTLPYDVQGQQSQQPRQVRPTPPQGQAGQPQYSSSAPTQRVGPTYPPQQQSYSYSQAQPPTQAAPPYYPPPTGQVNVNRRQPVWLWLLAVLAGLILLGGIGYALLGPQLPVVVGPDTATATPTLAGGEAPTATRLPGTATTTPAPATDTPQPTFTTTPAPTDTAVPVIVPTITPEPPTNTPKPRPTHTPVVLPIDTPEPAATDTPVPPQADYAATANADPREPKTPNGTVRITGTLFRGGQPVQGAAMRITLHYENRDDVIDGISTGPDGTGRITFRIGKASEDTTVDVDVAFFVDGQEVMTAQTAFTPRKK